MHENEISGLVLDSAIKVHRKIGPGLLESVYEVALEFELKKLGLSIHRQVGVPFVYEDVRMQIGFRADLLVGGKVVVEIKSVDAISPVHLKQLRTYLVAMDKRLGMLLNFNVMLIKDCIRRVVNNLIE